MKKMKKMKKGAGSGIKPGELAEELWERAKDFILQRKRNESKTYRRPG
ncbi:MAG: hypothetical protein LBL20_00670 [Treponema sp.]|jgi:hypothetical protein|nr:hypothetical protein [Treponema sp.]